MSTVRIGHGYDVHQLVEGRPLILGGVVVPHSKGLLGHSDADVLTHSVMDAILGALALGDIGKHFPDNDSAYKNAVSVELLRKVWEMADNMRYTLGNLDATIIAERPKLAPFIDEMRHKLADILNTAVENINIKATTHEGLGFEGEQLGIAAHCVCILNEI